MDAAEQLFLGKLAFTIWFLFLPFHASLAFSVIFVLSFSLSRSWIDYLPRITSMMAANPSKNYRIRHNGSFVVTIPCGENILHTENLNKLRKAYTMPDNEMIQFELALSPPKYWYEGKEDVDRDNLVVYLFEQGGPDGPNGKMYMRLKVCKKDRKELPVKFVLSLVDIEDKKKFSSGKFIWNS